MLGPGDEKGLSNSKRKAIEREIGDRFIGNSAILDRAATIKEEAEAQTKEAKARAKEVEDENVVGGNSIRSNAMSILGRRSRSLQDDSDKENSGHESSPKPKRSRHSNANNLEEIKDFLVASEDRRKKHDEAVLAENTRYHDRIINLLSDKL